MYKGFYFLKGGFMKKNYPRFTLRIPKELLEKISIIAEKNGRTKNREIEMTLRKYVSDFERLYGKITLEETEKTPSA